MSGSNTITFDASVMRAMLPAFSNPVQYPTALLQIYFGNATSFISDDQGPLIGLADQTQALYLMTAHLAALQAIICDNDGAPIGVVREASVDKVTVTLQMTTNPSAFQLWLSSTPYGQQLYALLGMLSVGGWYFGGSPQRAAFRGLNRGLW
jgi:hypothetical protein